MHACMHALYRLIQVPSAFNPPTNAETRSRPSPATTSKYHNTPQAILQPAKSNLQRTSLPPPPNPSNTNRELNPRGNPQHSSNPPSKFSNPPTSDRTKQGNHERGNATIALLVPHDEQTRVGHQVAKQTSHNDRGDLADAQTATDDDLARGLEGEEEDGCFLGPVDVVW